jgi:hypothetical protein
MPIAKGVSLLNQIKNANEGWFSLKNKRFFKDINYYGRYGKATHKPYLVRSTVGLPYTFGKKPQLHYLINIINQDSLKIEDLIDEVFNTIEDVKEWLEVN